MNNGATHKGKIKFPARLLLFFCSYLIPFFQDVRVFFLSNIGTLRRFLDSPHFLTVSLFFAVVVTIFFNVLSLPVLQLHTPAPTKAIASINPQTLSSPDKKTEQYKKITGELLPGDTLRNSFQRAHVDENMRVEIIKAFRGVLDFRSLRPHDKYTVLLNEKGLLVKCSYESGPLRVYTVTRAENGELHAEKLKIPLTCRTVKVFGTIQSSLFEAFSKFTKDPKLIYTFADIFASRIDFNTESRQGDRFSLVFEKYFKGDTFVSYGRILVARYEQAGNQPLEGYYYIPINKSSGAYFDQDGRELGTSFIRSPVPVARISSRFTFHRLHPILGIVRPHLGVDLAAPYGTPIMAAADGKVKFVGRHGGFGKQIVLEHGSGYKTYYGHLSRFRKGLKKGSRVKQKEIIGYVGATGLATGPHLDYRISFNGVFKNPFSLRFQPKSILKDKEFERFHRTSIMLAQLMKSLDDPAFVLVKNVTLTPDVEKTFL